jgi:hypothetical protein
MSSRFSRSWSLMKASGTVLKQDKELMVFPLLSVISTVLVAATFIVPLIASGAMDRLGDESESQVGLAVIAFLFYLSQYFVIFFFNAALVGAAMIRLDGGDPTVADGLRIARAKALPILGYAAIAATIGLILRAIEERAGFVGRWIAGLFGVAFTVATFLAVPILVTRDVGPVSAVKESAALLKKTWGENIIGNAGLGFAFFLIYLAIFTVGAALAYFALTLTKSGTLALVVAGIGVIAVVCLALFHTALQGVYSAALYRYASTGEGGAYFDDSLLNEAFRHKAKP